MVVVVRMCEGPWDKSAVVVLKLGDEWSEWCRVGKKVVTLFGGVGGDVMFSDVGVWWLMVAR